MIYQYKETKFKCPICKGKTKYNNSLDLFECFKEPVINNISRNSCGRFYANGVKAR